MNKTIFLFVLWSISSLTIPIACPQDADEAVHERYDTGVILSLEPAEISADLRESGFSKMEIATVKVTSGKHKGKSYRTEVYYDDNPFYNLDLKSGDKVVIVVDEDESGNVTIGIVDRQKTGVLIAMGIIFVAAVVVLGRFKGVKALISLGFTLFLVFGLMLPLLLRGYSPIGLVIVFSLLSIAFTMAVVAGLNRKAYSAMIGTFTGVLIAMGLSILAVTIMRLSGFTSQESMYLSIASAQVDMRGLLVCGMIVGALGAVMDVAISISSAIAEVQQANPLSTKSQLYRAGMNVGRDIIGTMINTLVLAYTGGSLAVVLLIVSQRSGFPLVRVMNMDFFASEILRALAGSIGMVLTVPMTSLVASRLIWRAKIKQINKTGRQTIER